MAVNIFDCELEDSLWCQPPRQTPELVFSVVETLENPAELFQENLLTWLNTAVGQNLIFPGNPGQKDRQDEPFLR